MNLTDKITDNDNFNSEEHPQEIKNNFLKYMRLLYIITLKTIIHPSKTSVIDYRTGKVIERY